MRTIPALALTLCAALVLGACEDDENPPPRVDPDDPSTAPDQQPTDTPAVQQPDPDNPWADRILHLGNVEQDIERHYPMWAVVLWPTRSPDGSETQRVDHIRRETSWCAVRALHPHRFDHDTARATSVDGLGVLALHVPEWGADKHRLTSFLADAGLPPSGGIFLASIPQVGPMETIAALERVKADAINRYSAALIEAASQSTP